MSPASSLYRYMIALEYDGSRFAGFQLQPRNETIQQVLEKTIRERFHYSTRIMGASRTDAGVHASGQIAAFDLNIQLPTKRLVAALNSSLPKTIRVTKAKLVDPHWQPRYQARYKTYCYYLFDRPITSPFWEGRAWQTKQRLNIRAMQQAAEQLVGRHDFSAFRAAGCGAKQPIREIYQLNISRKGYLITITIQGNGFLYYMVRNIVGTLVKIGLNKWPVEKMSAILKSRNRQLAGPTAPACGLVLKKVNFLK